LLIPPLRFINTTQRDGLLLVRIDLINNFLTAEWNMHKKIAVIQKSITAIHYSFRRRYYSFKRRYYFVFLFTPALLLI